MMRMVSVMAAYLMFACAGVPKPEEHHYLWVAFAQGMDAATAFDAEDYATMWCQVHEMRCEIYKLELK